MAIINADKKINRVSDNKFRTTNRLILNSFNAKLAIAEKEKETAQNNLRTFKAALSVIENVDYDFDEPTPVHTTYTATSTTW